jgi:omega-6 fatty acid desaturase (delta-12 desaturase)
MELNRDGLRKMLRTYELRDDSMSYGYFYAYMGLFVFSVLAAIWFYNINLWASAIFWFPIWVVFCKCFVFMHDCGHFSLFKSNKMNRAAGFIAGFLILVPSALWNHVHNSHHAITGNLNRREDNPGTFILTTEEYEARPLWSRLLYRFTHSVFFRLTFLPLSFFLVGRIPYPKLGRVVTKSVLIHNVIYGVLLAGIIALDGFEAFAFICLIPLFAFYVFAISIFLLQHQFEDSYWAFEAEWDLYKASLVGSSYIKFGSFLNWVTGNGGGHHIHHINSRIPYYNLGEATERANDIYPFKSIKMADLFKHLSFVLWDDREKKMVSIKSLKNS